MTAALSVPAVLLFSGKTGWLSSFGRAKVKDRREYARFLGECLEAVGLVFFASGIVSLLTEIRVAVTVLAAGIIGVFAGFSKNAGKYYR